MPALGVGTCWLDETETEAAVAAAVALVADDPAHPGVHVDGAEAYWNAPAIGRALSHVSSSRDRRIFLASKLSRRDTLSYDGAKRHVAETLRDFGVPTLDLYSLHSSFGAFRGDADSLRAMRGAWRALSELVDAGTIRALGVSNFDAHDLRHFVADPELGTPSVLQNKFDPYRRGAQHRASDGDDDDDVVGLARELGIALVSYSSLSGWPFGFGALADPVVHQLARHFDVAPAALVLRWILAKGHAVIPRSSRPDHVRANLRLLDDPVVAEDDAWALLDGLARLGSSSSGASDGDGDRPPPFDVVFDVVVDVVDDRDASSSEEAGNCEEL